MNWVVVLDLVAACCMTGLIWFVQLVHYPLLAAVPPEAAIAVAVQHQRRTAWVVALPRGIGAPKEEASGAIGCVGREKSSRISRT